MLKSLGSSFMGLERGGEASTSKRKFAKWQWTKQGGFQKALWNEARKEVAYCQGRARGQLLWKAADLVSTQIEGRDGAPDFPCSEGYLRQGLVDERQDLGGNDVITTSHNQPPQNLYDSSNFKKSKSAISTAPK